MANEGLSYQEILAEAKALAAEADESLDVDESMLPTKPLSWRTSLTANGRIWMRFVWTALRG